MLKYIREYDSNNLESEELQDSSSPKKKSA
jgi:hypothetical protein